MFKVMIVDDEKIIRESICALIPWEQLGLKLVASCKDGIEAYNALQDEMPDIIMTDIRMPGMSGIDLIKKAYDAKLNVQFIILSGYNEFEYAQSAMKYGVKQYLLKPCNENQIISVLKDVINDCKISNSTVELEKEQAILKNTLLQNVMISLINDAIVSIHNKNEPNYEHYKQYLDFEQTPYKLITINIIDKQTFISIYQDINNIHVKYAPNFPLYGFYASKTLFLFTVDYHNYDNTAYFSLLNDYLNGKQYKQQQFQNFRTLLSSLIPQILYYEGLTYINGTHLVKTNHFGSLIHSIKDLCSKICNYYNENNQNAELVKEYFDKLKCFVETATDFDFLIQISGAIFLTLSTDSIFLTPIEATEYILKIQQNNTTEQVRNLILEKLDCFKKQEPISSNHFIAQIQQYVKEHISDPNLTLKWIATNYLYMNVDYISRKFVKETGSKFSAYLTDVRVQKAKELIAINGAKNIGFIAEQVGCGNNPQYFNQIFKKHTGMTINAYATSIGKK